MSPTYSAVFRSPRVAAVLILGFSSGLPLALTGSTLQAWLSVSGIEVATIAWFSWVGMLTAWFAPEPEAPSEVPKSLSDAIFHPLKDLFTRRDALWLLALVMLYKFGDALAGTLTTAFLIRGVGFTPTDVGVVNKGLGLAALLFGALAGGTLLARMSLYRALLVFGVLQAVSNLSFSWLALAGKSYPLLVFAVGFENLASGMGTAAFVAFAMALCNHSFSATQYALLSAMASLGRILFGPAAGWMVQGLGWDGFFVLTFFAALPGLALVWWMRATIDEIGQNAMKPART